MKRDALFQLGMGPVVLDTTQTEDNSSLRPALVRNAGLRARRAGEAFPARTLARRSTLRFRGNGAGAPMTSA